MDRRLTPANARAAHVSLRGRVDAPHFTEGEAARVARPVADLLAAPEGPRERQILFGEAFLVIDRDRGMAFGQAAKDAYCGYVAEGALAPPVAATHWVSAPATHLYPEPRVQAREVGWLPMGARVAVTDMDAKFAETPDGFIPLPHLRPLAEVFADPVAVAEALLGTPYLWGGNSRAGIDCSGLVQGALLACGIACPGDSDLQAALGHEVAADELRRGDLLFWKGHVAFVAGPDRILHANGHSMSTAFEGLAAAITRIEARGGGPVTARRRVV